MNIRMIDKAREKVEKKSAQQIGPCLNRRNFLARSIGAFAMGAIASTPAVASQSQESKEAKGPVSLPPAIRGKSRSSSSIRKRVAERDQWVDPKTGIKVIQITSYPLPTAPFKYSWPSITPDNQRVVFFAQIYSNRDSPWDFYRCDTDGLELCQLTQYGDRAAEGYYGAPVSILSLDGATIYTMCDKLLCEVDVETGKIVEIRNLDDLCPEGKFGSISFSSSGVLFIGVTGNASGAIRVNLQTGKADRIEIQGKFMGCFQEESRLLVQRGKVIWGHVPGPAGTRKIVNVGEEESHWSTNEDGADARFFAPQIYAHSTILGKKSMVQGCGRRPHQCLWLAEEGKEPRKLMEGPYFWHSGASYDGDWIVADTNTPDEGLQLAHVPSRHFKALCFEGPHRTITILATLTRR